MAMHRKKNTAIKILGFLLTNLLLSVSGLHILASEQNRAPPNILLIYTDDQKRDEFNYLPEGKKDGIPRNLCPTMDRLCEEGMVFTHFYISAPVCTPSRYNLLTGNYASRALVSKEDDDGMIRLGWNSKIREETPQIASYLKNAGYYTGFVGKNHTYDLRGKEYVKDKDFTDREADDPEVVEALTSMQNVMVEDLINKFDYDFAASLYRGNITTGTYPTSLRYHNLEWMVKGAHDFLDSAKNSDKPFFLHFATTLTHSPFSDGTSYLGNVRATGVGLSDDHLNIMPGRESILERVLAAGKDSCQADITWIDDGIEAILHKIQDLGELENTIIIYLNDNGPAPGKSSLYELGARTFGFIWGYGKKGVIYDKYLTNIDVMPTILEMAGIPENNWPEMDGISMVNMLNNPSITQHESVYLEIGFTRAVVKNGFKYLAFRLPDAVQNAENQAYHLGRPDKIMDLELKAEEAHPYYFDPDQLYDIRSSISDTINLLNSSPSVNPAIIEDLQCELKNYLINIPGLFKDLKSEEGAYPEECTYTEISSQHEVFNPKVIRQHNHLILQSITPIKQVQLFDIQGHLLYEGTTDIINISSYKQTLSIIRIYSENQVYTEKILL